MSSIKNIITKNERKIRLKPIWLCFNNYFAITSYIIRNNISFTT